MSYKIIISSPPNNDKCSQRGMSFYIRIHTGSNFRSAHPGRWLGACVLTTNQSWGGRMRPSVSKQTVVNLLTGSNSALLPSRASNSPRWVLFSIHKPDCAASQKLKSYRCQPYFEAAGGIAVAKIRHKVFTTEILMIFSHQEPENQVITAGQSLTLSCFVSAEKPVQYYWYKMSTLPSGDMTSDDNLYLAGWFTRLCPHMRSIRKFKLELLLSI